jgi:ATP-dependent DNA ligase
VRKERGSPIRQSAWTEGFDRTNYRSLKDWTWPLEVGSSEDEFGFYDRRLHPNGDGVGSILVGYYDGREVMYAAGVRGGFSPEFRQVLLQHFEQLRIARCPFAHLPERTEARGAKVSRRENGPVAWLDPFIVVRIEFLEWTPENRLCHPRFAAMRSDKDAREVTFKGTS